MSGVKGRSGGARPGAGARPKLVAPVLPLRKSDAWAFDDPREYLMHVMNHATDERMRVDAAKSLLPYCYPKADTAGKKEEQRARSATADRGTDWAGLLQ